MDLRCKVFRSNDAREIEDAVNRFLADELPSLGPVQFEEITQSESPSGVTIVVWYSMNDDLADAADDSNDYEGLDELDGKELA